MTKLKAPLEKNICKAFVKLFYILHNTGEFKNAMLIHIPNEQYNNVSYTQQLIALGLMPGAADYLVLGPYGRSFFIEFKREEKSNLSPKQRLFKEKVEMLDFFYLKTCSVEEAIDHIRNFLNEQKK